MSSKRVYQFGFGNHFSSEALNGALPVGQNSPQKPPYGLLAELLSGTAFTMSRQENLNTWLYKIRPSVSHGAFDRVEFPFYLTAPLSDSHTTPQQLRWSPMPQTKSHTGFLEGIRTYAANGDASMRQGSAIHLYSFDMSMVDSFFCNADGHILFVPQGGDLLLRTECGEIDLSPSEIAVVPRGMKFQVRLAEGVKRASGYMLEIYGEALRLPELGPLGSSGLANARDFMTPTAAYEDVEGPFNLIQKYAGSFHQAEVSHSPLDVVAWHGNYVPYKYDLKKFNTINTVSYDHPDPSIFTVLTSPSVVPGSANIDFVIFPPRWMVAQNSFRPPYFHRNVMSEFMGLIHGVYDGKTSGGFEPGGASLHTCMTAHGPESAVVKKARESDLKPEYLGDTLAFMFESSYIFKTTEFASKSHKPQGDYHLVWSDQEVYFNPEQR